MQAETEPVSLSSIAKSQKIPAKEFITQYKNHISGFYDWDQLEHADEWLLFSKNIGKHLSIDEVADHSEYSVLANRLRELSKDSWQSLMP